MQNNLCAKHKMNLFIGSPAYMAITQKYVFFVNECKQTIVFPHKSIFITLGLNDFIRYSGKEMFCFFVNKNEFFQIFER